MGLISERFLGGLGVHQQKRGFVLLIPGGAAGKSLIQEGGQGAAPRNSAKTIEYINQYQVTCMKDGKVEIGPVGELRVKRTFQAGKSYRSAFSASSNQLGLAKGRDGSTPTPQLPGPGNKGAEGTINLEMGIPSEELFLERLYEVCPSCEVPVALEE